MPRRGLEPPRPYGHQHLKLARLPIPPPGPVRKRRAIRLGAGDVNSGHEAPATGAFLSSAVPPVHDEKDQVSGNLRNVGAAHQMRAMPEPLRNPGQWPLTPPNNPARLTNCRSRGMQAYRRARPAQLVAAGGVSVMPKWEKQTLRQLFQSSRGKARKYGPDGAPWPIARAAEFP